MSSLYESILEEEQNLLSKLHAVKRLKEIYSKDSSKSDENVKDYVRIEEEKTKLDYQSKNTNMEKVLLALDRIKSGTIEDIANSLIHMYTDISIKEAERITKDTCAKLLSVCKIGSIRKSKQQSYFSLV